MFNRLKNWFSRQSERSSSQEEPSLDKTGTHATPRTRTAPAKVPRPIPEFVDAADNPSGKVEDAGPGKNVLVRNKYVREDTGTHETLKIVDDSMVSSGEETGFDPYNTGGFDRSRNWDKRFGK